jgi:glutamate--cysteine ligase
MSSPDPLRLPLADLLGDIHRAMEPNGIGERLLRVGMEAELIPVDAAGVRLPIEEDVEGRPGGRSLLADVGRRLGWKEAHSAKGAPLFRVPGCGVFSFEPGGQIELSTDAFACVGDVWEAARRSLRPLYDEAEVRGVRLITRGMDPDNRSEDVPLQVTSSRYRRQRAHYRGVGPWGERMMVLSAAIHVNVDLGGRAVSRWRAANRMAPWLTALFANSPRMEGEDAGWRSARAGQWRFLDPTRTGVFPAVGDPAGEYLGFALDAIDFLGSADGEPGRPFRDSWERGATREAWHGHLTTLFPEVRPRGYLELRSFDTLPPRWLVVPAVVCVGALYDPEALREVEEVLPDVGEEDLVRAGRHGVRDTSVRSRAMELFDVAIEGARRLGTSVVDPASLERALDFRQRFPARSEDPGHEEDDARPFPAGE